jgi:hypothetical protein
MCAQVGKCRQARTFLHNVRICAHRGLPYTLLGKNPVRKIGRCARLGRKRWGME